jgi:hypothetical protein
LNRYKNIQVFKTDTGKRYLENIIYPHIPETENDVYMIATAGDRYDTLASQYYKDSTLWWVIASANNSMNGSLIPTPGTQLRIPADKSLAIKLYNQVNSTR